MDIEVFKRERVKQHGANLTRWGIQPHATLILEMEDQMNKLREAFLHPESRPVVFRGQPENEVKSRLINIGSLVWAIAEELEG